MSVIPATPENKKSIQTASLQEEDRSSLSSSFLRMYTAFVLPALLYFHLPRFVLSMPVRLFFSTLYPER